MVTIGASVLAAAPASAVSSCAPAGSTALAHDTYATVYWQPSVNKSFVCVNSTGHRTLLKGAKQLDAYALGGQWVAYTTARNVVHAFFIPSGAKAHGFPFGVGDTVDTVVVKSDGAVAWLAEVDPSVGSNYVQGTDRKNHEPDELSDDSRNVTPFSLKSLSGHRISWKYDGGGTGTASLF
jgi:hypothetical protein